MQQPTLFPTQPIEPDICRRKHGGATTSVAADRAVDKEADRATVLAVVRKAGPHGATLDEVSARLNRPPNQISGRFTELRKKDLIIDTGRTRPTRAKSPARVYVAV